MSQTTLSLAKTTQPSLSMVLNRERIFNKINNSSNAKAVWITGPPGSGKTTMIASYLAANNQTSLWYQLDSVDADIATFFHYLRRTTLKHSKASESRIPLLGETQDFYNYGSRLFRSIFSCYTEPILIIFDNIESLLPLSDLHQILANAINEVPNNSKIVFVSRLEPSSAFSRACINQSLILIDGNDLKLSEEEYIQLARIRETNLTEDGLKEVHNISAGWITGFIITLEYAKRSDKFSTSTLGNNKNILFNYVAEEIFSNFDDVTKSFLLKVCWPRKLSVKIAKTLSDEPKTHIILSNLTINNYFVTEREDEKEIEYIIHPLLRDFLQSQSQILFNESTIVELQKTTAELLVIDGQPEEAAELSTAIHDWEQLELIILQHASLLIQQGRSSLLTKWLEELPIDRLENNAWLLYWFGKSRHIDSPREARNYYESAYKCFNSVSNENLKGTILSCCGVIEAIISGCDDYKLLDDWISSLINHLPDDGEYLEEDELAFVVIVVLIALVIRNEGKNNLTIWFDRADQAISKISDKECHSRYKLLLVLAYTLTGQFSRSNKLLSSFQKENRLEADNSALTCKYLLLGSLNEFLKGDGIAAEKSADVALSYAQEYSIENVLPYIYACHYCASITQGDLEKAGKWLTKLSSVISNSNRLLHFYDHYFRSWYALLNNDIIKAYHEQKQAQSYSSELGIKLLEAISTTALAQLLYLCDDTRTGEAQLRRVHSITRDIQNPLLEFMTLLTYGDVAIRENRISSGMNALRYALGLGRTNEYYYVPWWRPQQLSEIFAIALRNKIEVDYVRNFITQRNLETVNPPIDVKEWPWSRRVFTLGGFNIDNSNNEKLEDGKGQGRPLLLLKILIALGGRNINAKKIAKILWPHVDDEYGNKSLTINLHRLRKLLGGDDIIFLRDGNLSINTRLIWVDVLALEQAADHIKCFKLSSKPNYNLVEMEKHTDRLLNIYQGSFLSGDDEMPCFVSTQECLRKVFHDSLEMLVDVARTHDDIDRIVELYEEGISRDPSLEAFYHQLMIIYHDQNKDKNVTEVFNRCCSALAKTPQEKPSEKTTALYKSIF